MTIPVFKPSKLGFFWLFDTNSLSVLRITCETLKDTEKKLNEELEMRALLTTELDSKEDLKVRLDCPALFTKGILLIEHGSSSNS